MMESIIFLLGLSLPVLLIGLIWIVVRHYTPRLSRIDDELLGVTVMLEESSQQLRKITSMLEEDSKTELTRADLVNSSRLTNDSLKKVLWQMRFDENKYAESTATTANGAMEPDNAGIESINKQRGQDRDILDDPQLTQAALNNSDDRLSTIFDYITKSESTL